MYNNFCSSAWVFVFMKPLDAHHYGDEVVKPKRGIAIPLHITLLELSCEGGREGESEELDGNGHHPIVLCSIMIDDN